MNEQDILRALQPLVAFVKVGLQALTERLLLLLGMLLAAGGFGWVLWQPDWIRFAGACAFALLVYWPVVRLESGAKAAKGE